MEFLANIPNQDFAKKSQNQGTFLASQKRVEAMKSSAGSLKVHIVITTTSICIDFRLLAGNLVWSNEMKQKLL